MPTWSELHRQLDRLGGGLDPRHGGLRPGSGQWQLDGARSAAGWIAHRCHRPTVAAKAEVALGRALRHLPVCEAAWQAGDIGADHVRTLARLRRPATQDRLAQDEDVLVGHATGLAFHHFTRLAAYWAQCADPGGEDERAEDQRDQRRCHLSQSFGAMWFADIVLDPLSGAAFDGELSRLEQELFDADWAAARARLGREPTIADLGRTPAQRRADALVEMAARSAAAPAGGRRPGPLFSILVGWETFHGRICQLANGTVAAPGALVPWLSEAWLERIVFASPSRVIDVGTTRRLFTGATRRAVEIRDQRCFHDLCDAPAGECQVDHIVPYSAGGPTNQRPPRLRLPQPRPDAPGATG